MTDEALTRVEFERTVRDLVQNVDRGGIPDAAHEIATLWWGLPSRSAPEPGIEGLDATEESLVRRIYADYCDATDYDLADAAMREEAARSLRSIVEALSVHITQRRVDQPPGA